MTIKVDNTKTIRVEDFDSLLRVQNLAGTNKINKDVLVTDAKLVLVECLYSEGLLSFGIKEQRLRVVTKDNFYTATKEFYKPILISQTEKIEVGDYAYPTTWKDANIPEKKGKLMKCTRVSEYNENVSTFGFSAGSVKTRDVFFDNSLIPYSSHYSKVLALPEHFSPETLQDIVEGKFKEGDYLLIECEDNTYIHQGSGKYWEDEPVKMKRILDLPEQFVKLNNQNHIIVHPSEVKKYTKEEWFNIMDAFSNPSNAETIGEKAALEETAIYFNSFKKWFLKKYK